MRTLPMNKKAVAILAAGLLIATAGGAYAYWTVSGSGINGAASAASGDTIPMTIVQFGTTGGLVPGGGAGTVSVKATNPASYSQQLGEVTATATYPGSCPAANWTLTHVNNGPTMLAGLGVSSAIPVATIKLDETGANQDGCKSATVTFTFAG